MTHNITHTINRASSIRKSAFALCIGVISLIGTSLTHAADWQFDLNKTNVTFITPPNSTTQVTGQFKKFDGQITGDVFDQQQLQIQFTVQTNSVDTGLLMRDHALKGSSLFNSDQYPTATFKSTSATQIDAAHVVMQGNLTMLGITKPLKVNVTLDHPKIDPVSKSLSIGTTADSTIKRSEWGMTGYSGLVGNDIAVHLVSVMTSNNVNADELAKISKAK